MLKAAKIALNFPEEKIPPLPNVDKTSEIRALIALFLEKSMFCEDDVETYEKNIPIIFEETNIEKQKVREKLLKLLSQYESFLTIMIGQLFIQETRKLVNEGTFEYSAKPYIYFSDEEEHWCVDLDKLQEFEVKYDKIDLLEGKLICIFNPTKDGKIIIRKGDIAIREDDGNSFLQQQWRMVQGGPTPPACYNCGNFPCTCTSPDYTEWDKLMEKANDRDVILVYQDGEEVKRF